MPPFRHQDCFYLDSDAIENLHNSVTDQSLSTRSDEKTAEAIESFLAKAVGDPVASALGQLNTNSPISNGNNKTRAVVKIIEELSPNFFSSLPLAAKCSIENNHPVFFFGNYDRFRAPKLRTFSGFQSECDEGALTFSCEPEYVETDDYYKCPRFKAEMICSLSKMPTFSNGIPFTSYLALHLRASLPHRIRLWTFCSVLPLKHIVQLKPYAIWV